jgi:RNA polymerase-binding transcription factor DksA
MINPNDPIDVDVFDETDLAQLFDLNWTSKSIEDVRNLVKTNTMTPVEIAALIANSPVACEECDDPIDDRRRHLEPGTRYCTDCREFLDKKTRLTGIKH